LPQVELDGGGEGRPTHPDDARGRDPGRDCFRFQRERVPGPREVVTPAVLPIGLEGDGAHREPGGMMGWIAADTHDASRGRGMDRGRDGPLGMAQEIALGDPLAPMDQGRGGGADMLLQRDMQQGGQGQVLDRLPRRQMLACLWVNAPANPEKSHVRYSRRFMGPPPGRSDWARTRSGGWPRGGASQCTRWDRPRSTVRSRYRRP
jgi:hypothetical protein